MSDTYALAARLRAQSDAELISAVRRRELRPGGIKDFFDLAEALLDLPSIQQQLTRLDRSTLSAIAALADLAHPTPGSSVAFSTRAFPVTDIAGLLKAAGDAPADPDLPARLDSAVGLLLAERRDDGYAVYDRVAEQIRSWPAFGLPGLTDLASAAPPAVLEPLAEGDRRFIDRLASERAFTATNEVTELLVELEKEPARELAKGGIALPDTKRLAHAMSVDLESVSRLVAIAEAAHLIVRESGAWLITEPGGAWLLGSSGERWRVLAEAWAHQLPADIRALLAARSAALWGDGLTRYITWLYPAGGEWMDERVVSHTRAAELLGVTANAAPSSAGALLFTASPSEAAATMSALFPTEVSQVYLQHDLSIVAPGPLTPEVDNRLRSLADAEGRALASSYRVSASSMNRAMAAGETAESVREFLSRISLTGIPQPLGYLITEAATRYGLLRAGSVSGELVSDQSAGFIPASYVRSDDDGLLDTVFVDLSLSALAFVRTAPDRLVSRYGLETVFWNLSDARYPVAAENAAGEIVALRRRRHARTAPIVGPDPFEDLIGRLRVVTESEPDEAEDAWIVRQLDSAIRSRTALTVNVSMPNGTIVEYQLEPTSMSGGRLRGRDRRSAIERTLPMSSVIGVAPPVD